MASPAWIILALSLLAGCVDLSGIGGKSPQITYPGQRPDCRTLESLREAIARGEAAHAREIKKQECER